MAKALTARSVEQAKPAASRREIADGLLPGLFLIVQPTGAKSWALRYRRQDGKTRKLTLGTAVKLSLSEARESARTALTAAARGSDPAGDKVAAKRQARSDALERRDHFATIAADFIERYARPRNRSWAETDRLLRREVLPSWGERRIQDIARRDVIELLDGIADRGAGTTANRVLAAIRRLFNWTLERGILTVSPCAGVKAPAPESSRDRVLNDDEIRWLWEACEGQGYPFGPIGHLLLLTGARREEVAGMTWAELDLDARIWTIPRARAKNDVEHHVPLSEMALSVLRTLPRISGPRDYVFTATGRTPSSGFSKAKETVAARMLKLAQDDAAGRGEAPSAANIPHWVWHDLRRTAASGMARLGHPVHVVESVLNHKSGTIRGVAKVYNRYTYESEKRHALDDWGRTVGGLVSGEPANVVALGPRRVHG